MIDAFKSKADIICKAGLQPCRYNSETQRFQILDDNAPVPGADLTAVQYGVHIQDYDTLTYLPEILPEKYDKVKII